jgi:hypothetical protein
MNDTSYGRSRLTTGSTDGTRIRFIDPFNAVTISDVGSCCLPLQLFWVRVQETRTHIESLIIVPQIEKH